MRLLNVHTGLLEEFFDPDATPGYAILSHTWGEDEVTFQDWQNGVAKFRAGYDKIEGCRRRAAKYSIDYIWVDTCCIDKKDPTELSEAINSMFQWYRMSRMCYVYLSDTGTATGGRVEASALQSSRWLTRGWTLQELLAPRFIIFFDRHWRPFGICDKSNTHVSLSLNPGATVSDVTDILSFTTHIGLNILSGEVPIESVTAAEKLSWAARRQTTRREDTAYCLLGILGVNMPLLYGEGDRAFIRLQEEYIRQHNDPSLLMWGLGMPCGDIVRRNIPIGALSPTPSDFVGFEPIANFEKNSVPFVFSRTNNGFEVELLLLSFSNEIKLACFGTTQRFYAKYGKPISGSLFDYFPPWRTRDEESDPFGTAIAVPLLHCASESRNGFEVYERALPWSPFFLHEGLRQKAGFKAEWKKVYLKAENSHDSLLGVDRFVPRPLYIDIRALEKIGFSLATIYPPHGVDCRFSRIRVPTSKNEQWFLTFQGPQDLFIGLFIDGRFRNDPAGNAFIGRLSMTDALNYVPSSNMLSRHKQDTRWLAEIRERLNGMQSVRIPGKRLGKPEIDFVMISVFADEVRSDAYGVKLLWDVQMGEQVDNERKWGDSAISMSSWI
ncbi:HET-domain-containing protein [Hypomontagnella monticulosa]|nr:HET-domain-containing protein [Hypomontagnella monticulosa]